MTDEVLKTPEEWDRELYPDSKIVDPDGWRGANGRPWTDPITKDEFERRRVYCTLIGRALKAVLS